MKNPGRFDVIVTENMFGDILTDEASVLTGSIGVLPSASVGARPGVKAGTRFGLYEPIHGSAPDIAGRGIANPAGAILSAAMLLRWSLGQPAAADALDEALLAVLEAGPGTPDLGGDATTAEVSTAVITQLAQRSGVAA